MTTLNNLVISYKVANEKLKQEAINLLVIIEHLEKENKMLKNQIKEIKKIVW